MSNLVSERSVLTESVIDSWVNQLKVVCEKYSMVTSKEATRLTLSLEEILLKCMKTYGKDAECQLTIKKSFSRLVVSVEHKGEKINPVEANSEDNIEESYDIMRAIGIMPNYSYHHNKNSLSIYTSLKKKRSMLYQIVLAIVLAVATYLILGLLPETVTSTVLSVFIQPVLNKIISVLSMLATPMVFFAVVLGIQGMGNVSSFSKIGKKVMSGMMMTYIFAVCVGTIALMIFYPMKLNITSGVGVFEQVINLFLDIIPDNLIQPFAIDNDLQVITLAIAVGLFMLILGDKVKMVGDFMKQVADLSNRMMSAMCKVLAFLVYLGISNILLTNQFSQLLATYKIIFVCLISAAVTILFVVLRTIHISHIPFKVLFSKQLPTLLINLATSSQVAAFSTNSATCKKEFGVDEKLVDFALPLGLVIYMPNGAAYLLATSWLIAYISGIPVTIGWFITAALVCIIVAIAAPPIPGSGLTVLPIVFSALGLPISYLPVAITIMTIIGYFLPAINGYCMQCEMILSGKKLNMIDESALLRPLEEAKGK